MAPFVIHTHWMQAVQEAFGTDIVIVNNKNKQVETVSTLEWTDPDIHAKQFQLHQKTFGQDKRRSTTFFIVHRVLTNVSLSKIRSLHAVQRILKDYKFYITDHQWTEIQWDTTRLNGSRPSIPHLTITNKHNQSLMKCYIQNFWQRK